MKSKKVHVVLFVIFLEFGFITLLTVAAIFNTRFELFEIHGAIGFLFTGLGMFFLPAHIGAMIMTNAADPPDLWGVIVSYSIQGYLVAVLGNTITLFILDNKKRSGDINS